eukprot:4086219-Amphidinium_carterae.1
MKMNGSVAVEVSPVPLTIESLKLKIEKHTGTPVLLQKLIKFGDVDVLEDLAALQDENYEMMLVIDETNMYMWDRSNNPSSNEIS